MSFEFNTTLYEKLELSFYENPDVVQIAHDLVGKVLFSYMNGKLTVGKIVETEAYCGRGDKACHANYKRTPRTEVMYGRGGHAYVYLCYGIHHLFNVVTNQEGLADAVLVRALEPLAGVDVMMERRKGKTNLTSGPGILSQAMGIHKSMSGLDLLDGKIWISEEKEGTNFEIEQDVRIGVDYAGEDALKPWRFLMKNSPFVSKEKSPGGLSPGS